jgi:hypothetical protein
VDRLHSHKVSGLYLFIFLPYRKKPQKRKSFHLRIRRGKRRESMYICILYKGKKGKNSGGSYLAPSFSLREWQSEKKKGGEGVV